ncbi:MAG: hypothetical protein E6R03_16495 [Hyphomicrobiaceae bacterium]|nr:MAG: hypothetical protein E6R03_16495 [Hyphomicrobiaceae bacterium]
MQPITLKNPEDVENFLAFRAKKMSTTKLPPPDRSGMFGELKHPTIPSIVTGWFTISPAKATAWLDYNIHNRKLSKGKVAAFARQHYHGEFVATHQGIAFGIDEHGVEQLIDGQHTLKMILVSEQPLTRMVTFGLPKKVKNFHTMDVIDAGGRSVSDQLKISHGITESGPKKQICMALASICHGTRTRNLGVGETLTVLNAFKASVEFVLAHRSKEPGLRQAGVLAGFAFAHAVLGAPVEKWFEELNSGKGLLAGDEYMALRKKAKLVRPLDHLRQFLTSPESALFSKSMNRAIAGVTLQVIYGEHHRVKTQQLEQSEVGTNWFVAKQKDRVIRVGALFDERKLAA